MPEYRIKRGSRMYRCVDCGRRQFMQKGEVNRRIRTRCMGCGGTFWEPDSDGAAENDQKASAARVAIENQSPNHATPKDMQDLT